MNSNSNNVDLKNRLLFRHLRLFRRSLIALPSLEKDVKRSLSEFESFGISFDPALAIQNIEIMKDFLEETIVSVLVLMDFVERNICIDDFGAVEKIASQKIRDEKIREAVIDALRHPKGILSILESERHRLQDKLQAYSNVVTIVENEADPENALAFLLEKKAAHCEGLKREWEFWQRVIDAPQPMMLYPMICEDCPEIAMKLNIDCDAMKVGEKHYMWWYIFMAAFIIYDTYK